MRSVLRYASADRPRIPIPAARPGGWDGGCAVAWRLLLGLCGLAGGLALLSRSLRRWGAGRGGGGRGGTSLPLAALGGLLATVVVQSSSLSVAGLVAAADSGAIGLAQAWAAVGGANVGTTLLAHLTGWRVPWAWLAAAGGVALLLAPRRATRALAGGLAGAVLLLGALRLLDAALLPGRLPGAALLARWTAAPWPAFLAGALLTAVWMSSGFSLAVIQSLAGRGAVPAVAAIAFVCGANVGTTADVLLASLGTGWRGRATAGFHLVFNLTCAGLGMALVGPLAAWAASGPPAAALARAHSGLNLATALLWLPAAGPAARWLAGRRRRSSQEDR